MRSLPTTRTAYDAANVIIEAILKVAEEQGADKVTSPAGKDAIIAAVAATNTDGVTGAVAFDEKGDTTNKAITTYQVEEWRVGPQDRSWRVAVD